MSFLGWLLHIPKRIAGFISNIFDSYKNGGWASHPVFVVITLYGIVFLLFGLVFIGFPTWLVVLIGILIALYLMYRLEISNE